jgi:Rrf2 family protein
MKLSQQADYGLVAVLYLSQKGEKCRHSLEQISQATGIPEQFLRKIFQTLVKSGIINSFKGKGGGASLARPPGNITISQVIEPLEREKSFTRCLRNEYCSRSVDCVASQFWQKTEKKLFEILSSTTLKDVIEQGDQKTAKS